MSVIFTNLGFSWPDGSAALSGLTGVFGPGRTGLIGANGSGKSTLLRLIAGTLQPSEGSIGVGGEVGYLPQTLTLAARTRVVDLLGVAAKRSALQAIESGTGTAADFEVLGDDWDIEERTRVMLGELDMDHIELDRPVGCLSGGEAMLLAIAGVRLQRAEVTLLDEPTNNLDSPTRRTVRRMIADWPGTVLVVSHDVALLDGMDRTAELYDGALTVFGGPYTQWRAHRQSEEAAAVQAARTAQQALKTEQRQRAEAETKLARRSRTGRRNRDSIPRIVANMRASAAQVSAGKLRGGLDDRVRSARAAADEAAAQLRRDERIRVELPDPGLAAGRTVVDVAVGGHRLVITGPERVALTGPNGVGKTSFLTDLLGGDGLRTEQVGYLRQRLDDLDDAATVLDTVQRAAPQAEPEALRGQLARFLFRGDDVYRAVGTLSGGERFRVALARLLLAEPPPQLVVLDEPTNNLDLVSVDQLVEALAGYRGALIVVSHDEVFLDRVGIDRSWVMSEPGEPTETVKVSG